LELIWERIAEVIAVTSWWLCTESDRTDYHFHLLYFAYFLVLCPHRLSIWTPMQLVIFPSAFPLYIYAHLRL